MKRLARIGGLAALLLVPACLDFPGPVPSPPNSLIFTDLTGIDNYGDMPFIAAGATLRLKVDENAAPAKLTSATSDHPERLGVKSFKSGLLVLQAGQAGIAHIDAKTATGESGHDFFVKAIASSSLAMPNERILGLPKEGIALPPGADYSFRLEHFDERGKELTGFGAEPISATPASALVLEPDSDNFHLVAPPTAGTGIDLHAGSIHETIDVADPATSVESIFLADGSAPAITQLPLSFPAYLATSHYYLGARLADGHYLLGPCDDFALDTVQGGPVVVTGAPDPSDPWRQLSLQFQFGTDVFSVTCFGKTVTYTANVQ